MNTDKLCDSLQFCGCGMPEYALVFVRDALSFIEREFGDFKYGSKEREEEWQTYLKKELEIFGSKGAAYFFYYWAHNMGFEEHGGSVPGWLTHKGKRMVKLLNVFIEREKLCK